LATRRRRPDHPPARLPKLAFTGSISPQQIESQPAGDLVIIASFRTKRNRNKETLHIVFYTLALCFLNVFKNKNKMKNQNQIMKNKI